MLERIFVELGPWNWIVLGCILLALEIVIPGVFLLWIGIGALLTGALTLQLWGMEFWSWQVQVLVFLALALFSAFAGRRIMANRGDDASDQPLLNRRADQLVGRTAVLEQPIENGRGRVRLDDTVWRVSGPELPAGTRVRISASNGSDLEVEAL